MVRFARLLSKPQIVGAHTNQGYFSRRWVYFGTVAIMRVREITVISQFPIAHISSQCSSE